MSFSLRKIFSWAATQLQRDNNTPVFNPEETLNPSLFDQLAQFPLSQHAHVSIDQQRVFCDPSYGKGYGGCRATHKAAKNVVKLMDAIRAFNITNYIVYYREFREKIENAHGGLYLIEPMAHDIMVPKTQTSAVMGGNILKDINSNNHKVLWITGFNTSACLYDTVEDLIERLPFATINIIEDATENEREFASYEKRKSLKMLEAAGANIVTAAQAYNFFKHQYETTLQSTIKPSSLHI